MKVFPDTKYIYKKENGVLYNLKNYAKLNYPKIFILFLCLGIIFYFSEHKAAVIFTIIIVTLNSYFLHKYVFLLGKYNPHQFHHNHEVSGKWWARIIEFVINVSISTNLALLFFNYMFKRVIFDPYVMIFYGILYTTTHIYTYHVYDVQSHKLHHIDQEYNIGPEYLDILCNTKYEGDEIENNNLFIPNIILAIIVAMGLKWYIPDIGERLTRI